MPTRRRTPSPTASQPDTTRQDRSRHDTVAAVFVTEPFEAWLPTFASLARAEPDLRIVAGATTVDTCRSLEDALPGTEVRHLSSSSALIDDIRGQMRSHVLLVWAPALFPDEFLSPALGLARADLRVASISFLSNVAGYASFPLPDVINTHQLDNLDEISVTRGLRITPYSYGPAPIPYPVGPAVLFSSQGLSLLSRFPDHGQSAWVSIAECGTRLRARGMIDLLDPSTFVTRPLDMPDRYPAHVGLADPEWQWLHLRSPALLRVPEEATEQKSPFREALAWAHSVVFGLRVILDGSCLGHKEMGTQVALLALVQALAERDEVGYLGIALAGPVPAYATEVLAHPKVDARLAPQGDISAFPPVDIFHCPFQTDEVDLSQWQTKAHRTVVTIHDLIVYQTPYYFNVSEHWFEYRESIRKWAASVDGVVTISEDARSQIRLERLAIPDDRVFVIPNGTRHLRGDESVQLPDELLARGFAEKQFILVLGTNYTHKNRDLAIRVVEAIAREGTSSASGHGRRPGSLWILASAGSRGRFTRRMGIRHSRRQNRGAELAAQPCRNWCCTRRQQRASDSSPTRQRPLGRPRWSFPLAHSRRGFPTSQSPQSTGTQRPLLTHVSSCSTIRPWPKRS